MKNKLIIQIWSDILCPFCYIGKRKIEEAISQFKNRKSVVIEWKSFQLDPKFISSPKKNMADHLAKKYKKDTDWANSMLDNMTENAKRAGLDFNFDKVILANSLNAHRLMHLAKKYNLASELKEVLFKAYFSDGKNLNDFETLKTLAVAVGMKLAEIEHVLNSDLYHQDVLHDQKEAEAIGINGVPFFIFDYKYAVSGAQPVDTFLRTIQKAWNEGHFDNEVGIINTMVTDKQKTHG